MPNRLISLFKLIKTCKKYIVTTPNLQSLSCPSSAASTNYSTMLRFTWITLRRRGLLKIELTFHTCRLLILIRLMMMLLSRTIEDVKLLLLRILMNALRFVQGLLRKLKQWLKTLEISSINNLNCKNNIWTLATFTKARSTDLV